ncbi:MAG: Na/Pi symporter [Gammaproteobacteria bacterium]|nr:Na/Pi cotransporter family protein [Pseudomonadales bacterium]MCP5348857.1 Na/Pi cotransporter family protein [Pseudomonadales bacterium]
MGTLSIAIAGLSAVILFIFGLDHFSKEIENIAGDRLRKSLTHATRIPVVGLLIGAGVTAVIQSSSATSVVTISLVNAGVISFKNSVGIIFGSNIGTTITAQLVAFKLTSFAPFFIIAGFILSLLRSRYSIFGKAVFYFGFVFFSLNLISSSLQPLQENARLIELLTQPQNPLFAIFFGCVFTAVVQSSSVTTGLAIVFTQQGLLGIENAVPIIIGANIGTTATALIAMFNMDIAAKKTALSHFLFNVGGVAMFLPVLLIFGSRLNRLTMDPAVALASIHLVFNVVTSIVFVIFITPFSRLIDTLLGEGKMDFQRLQLPVFTDQTRFLDVRDELEQENRNLFLFLQENYSNVTLSIETNYRGVYDAAEKRLEYITFVKKEYLAYFSKIVTVIDDENESKDLIKIINQFDYLFQIHDSIVDLFNAKKLMSEHYIELKSDILMLVRELSSRTLSLFDEIFRSMLSGETTDISGPIRELQGTINEVNRDLLPLLADPGRRDAGALTNFVTYSQRLKDKLVNFYNITLTQGWASGRSEAREDGTAQQPAAGEPARERQPQ